MMRMRRAAVVLMLGTVLGPLAPPARAAVNVEREGAENPVVEVAKATMYGALAGLVIGGAISAAEDGKDNGEAVRWGFVAGTAVGLIAGIYFTSRRPAPSPVIEFSGGAPHFGAFQPEIARGGARVRLIGTRF